VHVFKAITSEPSAAANPHVARWYTHIKSYAAEHASLPGSSTAGEGFVGESIKAPDAEGDDDEIDLFGEDEEEDAEAERVKAERVAAYNAKKANKPKTVAKVRVHRRLAKHVYSYSDVFTIFAVRRDYGRQAMG
jgi:elongation factor 1-beta